MELEATHSQAISCRMSEGVADDARPWLLASPYHRARQTRQSWVPRRPWGPRVASLSCRTRWSNRSHGATLARPPRHPRSSLFSCLALLSCRSWVTLQGQVTVLPTLSKSMSQCVSNLPLPQVPSISHWATVTMIQVPLPHHLPEQCFRKAVLASLGMLGNATGSHMPSVGSAPSLPRAIHNVLLTPSSASSHQI